MTESLWDWAVTSYRGDVPDICLDLQDAHGQNVPLLLWAAWCANQGIHADLSQAVPVVRTWDDVIAPLRVARRRLKPLDHETLRTAVKAVELQAEKALLDALAHKTNRGADLPPIPVGDAIAAAANAWAPGCPAEKLARLTQALSEA